MSWTQSARAILGAASKAVLERLQPRPFVAPKRQGGAEQQMQMVMADTTAFPTRPGAGAEERIDWTREIGSPGWQAWGGLIVTDKNPDFAPYAARGLYTDHGVLSQMPRTDGVLGGGLLAILRVIRSAQLRVEAPAHPTDVERAATDLVGEALDGIAGGMHGVLDSASRMLQYGFWLQESVWDYKRLAGGVRLVPVELADRPPWTISRWLFDRRDRLVGVEQCYPNTVLIPIQKCLLYTNDYPEGGPEGVSLLRASYFAWRHKQEILQRDAGVWEKWGYGVPIAQQTGRAQEGMADAIAAALADYATHLNGYIVGLLGYEIDIKFPAHGAPSPAERIAYLNTEILAPMLAGFLLHGDTGTRNVTSEQLLFFRSVCHQLVQEIADVIDSRGRAGSGLVQQIVNFNMTVPAGFRYPKVVGAGISVRDPAQLAALLRNLIEGRVIMPDPELELWARREFSLPERSNRNLDAIAA